MKIYKNMLFILVDLSGVQEATARRIIRHCKNVRLSEDGIKMVIKLAFIGKATIENVVDLYHIEPKLFHSVQDVYEEKEVFLKKYAIDWKVLEADFLKAYDRHNQFRKMRQQKRRTERTLKRGRFTSFTVSVFQWCVMLLFCYSVWEALKRLKEVIF